MTGRWAIYDRLLGELPNVGVVHDCVVSKSWILVRSEAVGMAVGVAKSPGDLRQPQSIQPPLAGASLRDVAACLKSWDLSEAAAALAALNSFLNSPQRVQSWLRGPLEDVESNQVFVRMSSELEGKNVAVVGHFPGLEQLADHCRLVILERNPREGDLPDFAAEYVLPEQDYVFITGTALVNKTLPRLLELSARAQVVLVGPSVPLTPLWFEWGVDILAGCVVTDAARVWAAARQGAGRRSFESGSSTVHICRQDVA